MVFVKLAKPNTFFKRFQVKFRRRRQGKTDYKARRRLVQQAKNKYNTPKYRLVARRTNKDIICQVVSAKIIGDNVICAAYSHELKSYGALAGFTNYAACYATGLLCARRLLTKLGLASKYEGQTKVTGARFEVQPLANDRKPFKCILDAGLARTTTGARIFGVMKGAIDGGLSIPHSDARFPGFKNNKLDTEKHRKRIFAVHVAEYQKTMLSEDATSYQQQFSKYQAASLKPDGIEAMWKKVHTEVRKNPVLEKKRKREDKKDYKSFKVPKYTTHEKKNIRLQKKKKFAKLAGEEG